MRSSLRRLPVCLLLLLEAAVLGLGGVGAVSAQSAPAQSAPALDRPSVSATGTADLLVAPDRAVFVVMIDSDASTAAAAGADNARVHAAVMSALMNAGAKPEELTSIGYSLQPQPQYNASSAPSLPRYRVVSSIRVQMARLDRLGAWIDAALAGGATRIGQIQFEPKDLHAARRQALALAVGNARADAEAMASAAGGTLGPLEALSTQSPGPRPLGTLTPLAATAESRALMQPTEIRPPELRVEAVVVGRWSYRPGRGAGGH